MATGVFLLCFIILNSLCLCSKISFPDSNEIPILSQDTLEDIKNNDGSKFVNVYNEYVKTFPNFPQKNSWREGEN